MTKTSDPELPGEDDLEVIDGPTELAPPDQIPTVYSNEPAASHPDWIPENTKIVTCRIANDLYPGERYESREEAKAAIEAKHGRILVANYVPGRAFFRVQRA